MTIRSPPRWSITSLSMSVFPAPVRVLAVDSVFAYLRRPMECLPRTKFMEAEAEFFGNGSAWNPIMLAGHLQQGTSGWCEE